MSFSVALFGMLSQRADLGFTSCTSQGLLGSISRKSVYSAPKKGDKKDGASGPPSSYGNALDDRVAMIARPMPRNSSSRFRAIKKVRMRSSRAAGMHNGDFLCSPSSVLWS